MWKAATWYSGLAAALVVLIGAAGYFDRELDSLRRWTGCGLLVAGVAMIIPATRRLAEDWPRLKPIHNTDVAFLQIMLGVVMIGVASMLGGRADAFFSPLLQPTPQFSLPAN